MVTKEKIISLLKRDVKAFNRYRRLLKRKDIYSIDLREADLWRANLRWANLHGADLRGANFHGADLRGANLDYASIPFQCSSFDLKCDERLIRQSLYHVKRYDYIGNDQDIKDLLNSDLFIKVCNKFHRVDECGNVGKDEK